MPDEATSNGLLPHVVTLVNIAAETLYKTVLTSQFPEFGLNSPDPAEIPRIIEAARSWARRVESAYGASPSGLIEPSGLWPLFYRPHEQQVTRHPSFHELHRQSPTFRYEGDGIASTRSYREQVRPIKPATFTWTAPAIMGDPPSQFADSLTQLLIDWRDPNVLPPIAWTHKPGRRPIPVDAAHWIHVREFLLSAHAAICARALTFVSWVRDQINVLENATMPFIAFVCSGTHGTVVLSISQAGASREVRVRRAEYDLLRALSLQGEATASPTTKHRLVAELPELSRWISSGSASGTEKGRRFTTYSIPAALQLRLLCKPVSNLKPARSVAKS